MNAELIEHIVTMRSSVVRNYALPGLTSSLLENGVVRLFEASRYTRELIVPHSHRFDFVALVLAGSVRNSIYRPVLGDEHDLFSIGCLKTVADGLGKYELVAGDDRVARYMPETTRYEEGAVYGMHYRQIHSIKFSVGAKVLMFEGPDKTDVTTILEPWVDGKRVPTFKVEEWMFEREAD